MTEPPGETPRNLDQVPYTPTDIWASAPAEAYAVASPSAQSSTMAPAQTSEQHPGTMSASMEQDMLELERDTSHNEAGNIETTLKDEITASPANEIIAERARIDSGSQAMDLYVAPESIESRFDVVASNTGGFERRTKADTLIAMIQRYAEIESAQGHSQDAIARNKATKGEDDLINREARLKHLEDAMQVLLQSVASLDVACDEQQRRMCLGKQNEEAPPEEDKYSLNDPRILDLLEEKYLEGYLDSRMTEEIRRSRQLGVNLPEGRNDVHLDDLNNEAHPRAIGKRAGHKFSWRLLCRERNRPEWDNSLSTRHWTGNSQFWNIASTRLPDRFFDGIEEGWFAAEAEMINQLDDEVKKGKACFQPVEPKPRTIAALAPARVPAQSQSRQHQPMQQRRGHGTNESRRNHPTQQTGGSAPADQWAPRCFNCMNYGHIAKECRWGPRCNNCHTNDHHQHECRRPRRECENRQSTSRQTEPEIQGARPEGLRCQQQNDVQSSVGVTEETASVKDSFLDYGNEASPNILGNYINRLEAHGSDVSSANKNKDLEHDSDDSELDRQLNIKSRQDIAFDDAELDAELELTSQEWPDEPMHSHPYPFERRSSYGYGASSSKPNYGYYAPLQEPNDAYFAPYQEWDHPQHFGHDGSPQPEGIPPLSSGSRKESADTRSPRHRPRRGRRSSRGRRLY